MNYTEKLTQLYGNVNQSCLSNEYNRDYMAISEAFKTICNTWSEENTLYAMASAMGDNPDKISTEFLQYYNIQKEEFAKNIIVAKKAMLDMNIYAKNYGVEKMFNINEASTPSEVICEINDLVDEFPENRLQAEKVVCTIEENVVTIETENGIDYSETQLNISWDDIVAAYTEEELSEKSEGYQDFEYDPETDEITENIREADDMTL